MKILVTGGTGQVGRCLLEELSATYHVVLGLGSADLDVDQAEQVAARIKAFQPNLVVNAAAYTAVDKAESEPDRAGQVNALGPLHLARAAAAQGAPIIHLSTDYVFDGTKASPYTTHDLPNPQGVYGHTKLQGERAVMANNPRHLVIRTAWVFSEYGHNFLKTILRLAMERDTLSVVSDQQGCPTYARDIARALVRIVDRYAANNDLSWGLWHYAGTPDCSWFEFASTIINQAAERGMIDKVPQINAIPTTAYPTPARRPANSRLDSGPFCAAFAVPPADWQTAVDHVLAKLRDQY